MSSFVRFLFKGVVQKSFLITILDDNIVEENEVFQVVLQIPEGGGSLGPQFRTNVTIIDDDLYKLSAKLTYSEETYTAASAGHSFTTHIIARMANGDYMNVGGDTFYSAIENNIDAWIAGGRQSTLQVCMNQDNGNGVYTVTCPGIEAQGNYQLRNWNAFPGGLKAEYFSDAFFEKLSVLRIDRQVNFTWGTGNLIPRGTDYISVRWSGVILSESAGSYAFYMDANEQARLWLGGDLILDHFQERRADLESPKIVSLAANTLYEIVLEYREFNGEAYAYLKWMPPGETLSIIPSSNLFSLYEIGNSPIEVTITADSISANNTECFGDGISLGVAMQPNYFSICPRDQYGNSIDPSNPTLTSMEYFNAELTLVDAQGYDGVGAERITPILVYNNVTQCIDASYTPYRAGIYSLNVTYAALPDDTPQNVYHSPFQVAITPNIAFGPLSNIDNLANPLYAEAGKCYNFTVATRDRAENLLLHGGDSIEVYMFRVDYYNQTQGVNEILAGAPTASPTTSPTSAPTYYLSFIAGNKVIASDTGSDVIRYGLVSDLGNGNYSVEICPVIAGIYETHVLLKGQGVSNQPFRINDVYDSVKEPSGLGSYAGQYIGGSPYTMIVSHTTASVIGSTASGPGLMNATVGVAAYFTLTVRDPYDNVLRDSNLSPSITLLLDRSPNAATSIWNYQNGSYLMEYVPTLSGWNLISVFINGNRIRSSPFMVYISAGAASSSHSYAEGPGLYTGVTGELSYFLVYALDGNGNREPDYSNTYKYLVVGSPANETGYIQPCPYPGDALHPICNPYESQGGYYFGQFVPQNTGTIKVIIYLVVNASFEQEISNSPFYPFIVAGQPHAENAALSGALYDNIAGNVGEVFVQMKDSYGNALTHGGVAIELAMLGVGGNQPAS